MSSSSCNTISKVKHPPNEFGDGLGFKLKLTGTAQSISSQSSCCPTLLIISLTLKDLVTVEFSFICSNSALALDKSSEDLLL